MSLCANHQLSPDEVKNRVSLSLEGDTLCRFFSWRPNQGCGCNPDQSGFHWITAASSSADGPVALVANASSDTRLISKSRNRFRGVSLNLEVGQC